MSLANYNDHLALSTSGCITDEGTNNCETSQTFSYLIIFNYINNTEININLQDYYSEEHNYILSLSDFIKIDNNIFGYKLNQEAKITSFSDEVIELYKITNTDTVKLNTDDSVDITNDKIKISVNNDKIKTSSLYSIEYEFTVSPASFDDFNSNVENNILYGETSINDQAQYESDFTSYTKTGKIKFKLCHELCETCYYLSFTDEEQKCDSCIDGYKIGKTNNCISQSDDTDNGIHCTLSEPYFLKSENKCNSTCNLDYILNSDCILEYLSEETLTNTYKLLLDVMKNNDGINTVIPNSDESVVFQLTNTSNEFNQNYNKDNELSSIILGDCETLLKKEYNIDEDLSLLIFKLEKTDNKTNAKRVQYEVYHPVTKAKLDLSVCSGTTIDILIPKRVDNKTLSLFIDLQSQGYDLFNPNDSFYNDICTKYRTENGTDVTLTDRKKDFYNNESAIYCQDGCTYKNYDANSQSYKCECSVDTTNINVTEDYHFTALSIVSSFYDVIKFSNIIVMKCYKLVFSSEGQKGNVGSYIEIILGIGYFVFSGIFLFTGFKKIEHSMMEVVFLAFQEVNNKIKKGPPPDKLNQNGMEKGTEVFNNVNNEKHVNKNHKRNSIKKGKKSNPPVKKKKKIKKTSTIATGQVGDPSRNVNDQIKIKIPMIDSQNIRINQSSKDQIKYSARDINKINKRNKKNKKNKIDSNKIKNEIIFGQSEIKVNEQTKKTDGKIDEKKTLSDFELDELDYFDALKYDKRTFLQFYWSLCKKEHLILFTFLTLNDYNLTIAKFILLVLSLCIDFATNCFFYNDSSMHKVYINYGAYDFLSQIPQMIYSMIISEIFDILIKSLALPEADIYELKKAKDETESKELYKKILKKIKIKFGIFFAVTFLILCFSWYFISAFCAVYPNTQMAFIKDSFGSFITSLIYPFGLYLIPAVLRITILRSKGQNNECLFKISNVLPII